MRKVLLLSMFAVVAACASAPKRLVEPDHTFLRVMCLNNGVYSSVCTCAEAKTVEETGIAAIGKDMEVGRKFLTVFQTHLDECNRELPEDLQPQQPE